MKRLALILVGLLLLTLFGAGVFARKHYVEFVQTPLVISQDGALVQVQPGDTLSAVVQRLDRQNLTRFDWRWRIFLRLDPVTIQSGEYRIPAGAKPGEFLAQLARGEVVQYRFTIIEGWTWRQLREALLNNERLHVEPALLADEAVMQNLGADPGHPEGWFLPETYAFVHGDSALDVLRRAHEAMEETLALAWASRADGLPLDDAYALLTLASIVEKESGLSPERPQIAGVFIRRLEQRWRLETDPTVIYGLGESFDGDIRRRDLEGDTPYNTYVHRGLPPTPIAMPGPSALDAVAHPAPGSTMFFVADGQGGHTFSDTLAEHNKAVQAYLANQRRNAASTKPGNP